MKNFINISDHSSGDLRAIIDEAKTRKLSRKGFNNCLLYTSPSPRDLSTSRMPSSA